MVDFWSMEIPKNANPQLKEDIVADKKVYISSKYHSKKKFSFQELSEFRDICTLDDSMPILCYGKLLEDSKKESFREHSDIYTRNELVTCCKDCPYAVYPNTDYINGRQSKVELLSYKLPYFIDRLYEYNSNWHSKKSRGCFVYFISDGEYVKIGVAKDVINRRRDLQTSNARDLEILFVIPCLDESCAYELESTLHSIYDKYRLNGEWFDISNYIDVKEFQNHFPDEATYLWYVNNSEEDE